MPSTDSTPATKTTSDTVPSGDLELCEQENSNLRKHLLWAAQFLSDAQKRELRDRLAGPIHAGGVVDDNDADEREEELQRDKAIEALTDHIERAVANGADDAWIATADELANQLRGFLRPRRGLTFHELKSGKY